MQLPKISSGKSNFCDGSSIFIFSRKAFVILAALIARSGGRFRAKPSYSRFIALRRARVRSTSRRPYFNSLAVTRPVGSCGNFPSRPKESRAASRLRCLFLSALRWMAWVNLINLIGNNPPSRKEIEQVLDYRRRRARARFYADENFPALATTILRKMGAKVVTVQEVGHRKHPDENHAAHALKHGYALFRFRNRTLIFCALEPKPEVLPLKTSCKAIHSIRVRCRSTTLQFQWCECDQIFWMSNFTPRHRKMIFPFSSPIPKRL